ncbi:hypothetical protein [Sicyoidochytrium minutum DNA virus]|nr:hypothetical protein [Sicyoidochytrium minutum DNA virus]
MKKVVFKSIAKKSALFSIYDSK